MNWRKKALHLHSIKVQIALKHSAAPRFFPPIPKKISDKKFSIRHLAEVNGSPHSP